MIFHLKLFCNSRGIFPFLWISVAVLQCIWHTTEKGEWVIMALFATSFWKCFQPQRWWESGLTAQLDINGRSQDCSAKNLLFTLEASPCVHLNHHLFWIMMFKLPLTGVYKVIRKVPVKAMQHHLRCLVLCCITTTFGKGPWIFSKPHTFFFCNLKQVFLFLPCTGYSKTSSALYLELYTLEDWCSTNWGR